MAFCGNCGNIIPDGAVVCPNCGAPVAGNVSQMLDGANKEKGEQNKQEALNLEKEAQENKAPQRGPQPGPNGQFQQRGPQPGPNGQFRQGPQPGPYGYPQNNKINSLFPKRKIEIIEVISFVLSILSIKFSLSYVSAADILGLILGIAPVIMLLIDNERPASRLLQMLAFILGLVGIALSIIGLIMTARYY